jgi:hypothetical protein
VTVRALAAALCVLALPRPAAAQPAAGGAAERPAHRANFRLGGSGDRLGGREEMCLEVAPIAALSVEGCGTGSGFLHRDDLPELAHFRAKLRLASVRTRLAWLEPQVGLGFAELQVGSDSPGFTFTGTDPDGVETSGLEVGVALRALRPLSASTELVVTAGVYLAWLPHAGELIEPQAALQPSASLTVGVGF